MTAGIDAPLQWTESDLRRLATEAIIAAQVRKIQGLPADPEDRRIVTTVLDILQRRKYFTLDEAMS